MSNALLEALAVGTPVVTTTVAGFEEHAVAGKHLLRVDSADAPALARAFGAVLRDEALARRLSHGAHPGRPLQPGRRTPAVVRSLRPTHGGPCPTGPLSEPHPSRGSIFHERDKPMRNFLCFTTTPAAGPHVDLAVATMQADGIGILDAEFCDPAALPAQSSTWPTCARLPVTWTKALPRFGIKLTARHHAEMQPLRNTLDGAPHWLILTRWRAADLEAWSVPPGQTLLLEITDVAQLDDVPAALPVGGFVAKGNEAGGHVGEDSAFVLAQKVLARTPRPRLRPGRHRRLQRGRLSRAARPA
ncbi:MAG: glycosyltransferase [Caldilineaceae bacterium]